MRCIGLLLLLTATGAGAQGALELGDRRVDAIVDPLRIEVKASMDRMREAVVNGGSDRYWRVKDTGKDQWELTLEVSGKHRITVAVLCDAEGCDIGYLDSINMLYSERIQSGAKVRAIHKNYNVWVRELANAIAAAMGAPTTITAGFARLGDVAAVPFLRDGGRKAYQEFLKHPKPRAFAVAENGAWGWSAPARNPTYLQQSRMDVVGNALARCRKSGGECRLYAVDDRVVWSPGP